MALYLFVFEILCILAQKQPVQAYINLLEQYHIIWQIVAGYVYKVFQ